MKNKKIKSSVIVFCLVLMVGIMYVAIVDEITDLLVFKENSGVIHAILYSAASVSTVDCQVAG